MIRELNIYKKKNKTKKDRKHLKLRKGVKITKSIDNDIGKIYSVSKDQTRTPSEAKTCKALI